MLINEHALQAKNKAIAAISIISKTSWSIQRIF